MKIKKIASIFSFCIATIAAFLPFNFIIGSKAACFSYASMAIPAIGYHYSLLYVILYFFTKSLFSYSFLFSFLLHRLPLFFATLALQQFDVKVLVFVPFISMILFCVHPIGIQVFYYSWYWFIPMAIYWFGKDMVYYRALAASFVAHAVGSVVWLYCGTIAPAIWTALMPLVIVERLIIAAGMIGFVSLFHYIDEFFVSTKVKV